MMVHGRRKEAWSHTSALICLVYNALSKEPKEPADFNPYSEKQKEQVTMMNFEDLRKIFFEGSKVDLTRGKK